MNPLEDDCRAMPVAHNGVGMVALCRCCGHVHVNLQYLTLRFEPEAFRELAGLMADAQARIDRLAPGAPCAADARARH